ncbi:MAG: GNAT family N-acetyltransferase [Candidatus Helarchaeota archaeon]
MEFRIRIMEKKDMDFCLTIITDLLGEPEEASKEALTEYFEDQQENSLMLVAENDEGKLIGFAGILIERWNATGNIEWIGILEKYRRHKIGSKLLKKLVNFADTKSVRKIYVDTAVDNAPNISFYIKNKFYPEAVLKEYYINGKDALKLAFTF